jgi:hypothetical protein
MTGENHRCRDRIGIPYCYARAIRVGAERPQSAIQNQMNSFMHLLMHG